MNKKVALALSMTSLLASEIEAMNSSNRQLQEHPLLFAMSPVMQESPTSETVEISTWQKSPLVELLEASFKGDLARVKRLVNLGIDVNEPHIRGYTSLHIATQNGHSKVVDLLLSYGANINVPTEDGMFALDLAAKGGYLDIVEILIDHGADINLRTVRGAPPFYIAAREGHVDIMKYLKLFNTSLN